MTITDLTYLVLLFITVSIIGWCIEVTLKYRQFHRFINRGFLTGPWLPIYGGGAVLITVAVRALSQVENAYGTTFVVSFILCGALEYFISWYLEKKYHARWWDYSQKPMNLKGRVWIGNLILFGLGGVAIMQVVNPLLTDLLAHLTERSQELLAAFLSVIFAADFVTSHFVMKLVKRGVESSQADNTEEMRAQVQLMMKDHTYFARRFADAYPEVVYRTERIQARLEAVRAEAERLRSEAEARVEAMNKRVEESREAVSQRMEESREAVAQRMEESREAVAQRMEESREAVTQRMEESREAVAQRMESVSMRIETETAQLAYKFEPIESIKTSVIDKQGRLIDLLYDEAGASEEEKALYRAIEEEQARIRKKRAGLIDKLSSTVISQ